MWVIERKQLAPDESAWERIESSWECPAQFATARSATQAARILALRHDGQVTFRVVGPAGEPLVSFEVAKYLHVLEARRPPRRRRLRLAAGSTIPLLADIIFPSQDG
jgi:hypothetical protein